MIDKIEVKDSSLLHESLKIEKESKPSMRTYIQKQKLDLERCNTSYIRL